MCVFPRQPLCTETIELILLPYSLEREGIGSPGNEGRFGTVFCFACGRGLDSGAPCCVISCEMRTWKRARKLRG